MFLCDFFGCFAILNLCSVFGCRSNILGIHSFCAVYCLVEAGLMLPVASNEYGDVQSREPESMCLLSTLLKQ